MPFGSITRPDTGFLPTILGSVGTAVCIGTLLRNLTSHSKETVEGYTKGETLTFLGYVGVIVLFLMTYKLLGYLSVFLLAVSLSKLSGLKGWRALLVFGVVLTASAYVLFDLLLAVPLPAGIFAWRH
jgi:hypothetical protein